MKRPNTLHSQTLVKVFGMYILPILMYVRICVLYLCYFLIRVDTLLTIKIADFGLAKDVYSTEYYRVDKHTTLPVKWMSLESLLDGYFDEKTDVVRNV